MIGKKRTETLRTDPDFKKLVKDLSNLKSFQEKDQISSSRITQAMLNQYTKYPNLLEEIKNSTLGKWKGK